MISWNIESVNLYTKKNGSIRNFCDILYQILSYYKSIPPLFLRNDFEKKSNIIYSKGWNIKLIKKILI